MSSAYHGVGIQLDADDCVCQMSDFSVVSGTWEKVKAWMDGNGVRSMDATLRVMTKDLKLLLEDTEEQSQS